MSEAERRARLERCRQYLDMDPANVPLLRESVEHATRLGEFELARQLAADAIRQYPDDAGFVFQIATLDLAQQDYAAARERLDTLLLSGHDHPAIRFNLAVACQQLGAHAAVVEALAGFTDAQWQDIPAASVLFGRSQHYLGALQSGIDRLSKHVTAFPDDAEAWGVLSLLKYDAEDADGSSAAAATALSAQPDNSEALLAKGSLALDSEDADAAMESMQRAVERHPDHGRAWSGRAFVHMLNLDLDLAASDFERAVTLMPDHVGTWHGVAWLNILKDDFGAARRAMDAAMALDRNFSETHGGLAVIATLEGKTDEARHHVERALRIDRESFSGRLAQALFLIGRGNADRASALIEQTASAVRFRSGKRLQDVVLEVLSRRNKRAAGKPDKAS